ncbi:MAG: CoA transferase, partial [Burkholderiales bacterium]|nr:CoA transferase [Burkholderiales bacterium]
ALRVSQRLCGLWFGFSLRPQGWQLPAPWDAVAGDYRCADGWIRLHTNAPQHRAAALDVLRVPAEREAVAAAVAGWNGEALETAIVERGGCAAAMRSWTEWQAHPQGRAVLAEPLLERRAGDAAARGEWDATAARPLQGLRVLDMTRVLAGPVATRLLAGLGAEVLRIDPPGWDEPAVVPEMTPGKRCARLDLREAAGRERWQSLLQEADVIVHGYRRDALEALGLGASTRRRLRPGLVDVSLDAYGFSGPWAARRGFDSLVQMSMGIAEAGRRATGGDRPRPLPVQALDHATGYLLAAAALRGLEERWRSGRGSQARTSLARIGALLMSEARDPLRASAPAMQEIDDDLAPAIENTAWGSARRLRWPFEVEGVHPGWDRPARGLGDADAAWQDRGG